MYLCALWVNYRQCAIKSITVAYNNAFRILLNLDWHCSASGMFVYNGVNNYQTMVRKHIYGLKVRVEASTNQILQYFIASDAYNRSKLLGKWTRDLYLRVSVL